MYRDDKWVIPCITGRGAMCSGICHLYKYSSFPSPNQRLVTIPLNLFYTNRLLCRLGRDDTEGLVWTWPCWEIRTRTRTHSWDQGSRSTRPQQQGYWEHWGKLGETGMSLLYSSERSQWALSEFKGQRWRLYCTCPKERWEVKDGRWGWATKGVKTPPQWHPGLPLQIWHITLKRPQACVRIGNENALQERKKVRKVRKEVRERLSLCLLLFYFDTNNTSRYLNDRTWNIFKLNHSHF